MIADTFTPALGLLGGALIGVAAGGLMLGDGRIAGVSGILGRSLSAPRADFAWRLAFLAGLPLGATLAKLYLSDLNGFAITSSTPLLVAGGLLVGCGTALGNGCTSGHGVCGIARGSKRSIVATLVFMVAGVATVFITRHALGVP